MHSILGCNHPTFVLPWRTLLPYLVALHLLHLGSAQYNVVAPSRVVTAIVGQDVVLRCHLSPCMDAGSSDIRWIQQQSSGLVHHYQNGIDLEQMAEYKGRTELLRNGLSDGNLELRITAVRSSDSGSYICTVEDGDNYAEAVVDLEVSDPFSQIVHPWKVALAVVITLLVASSVVSIVFLHRKRAAQSRELKRKDAALEIKDRMLKEKDAELKEKDGMLKIKDTQLEIKDTDLKIKDTQLEIKDTDLKEKDAALEEKDALLDRKDALLDRIDALLDRKDALLEIRKSQLRRQYEKTEKRAVEPVEQTEAGEKPSEESH